MQAIVKADCKFCPEGHTVVNYAGGQKVTGWEATRMVQLGLAEVEKPVIPNQPQKSKPRRGPKRTK